MLPTVSLKISPPTSACLLVYLFSYLFIYLLDIFWAFLLYLTVTVERDRKGTSPNTRCMLHQVSHGNAHHTHYIKYVNLFHKLSTKRKKWTLAVTEFLKMTPVTLSINPPSCWLSTVTSSGAGLFPVATCHSCLRLTEKALLHIPDDENMKEISLKYSGVQTVSYVYLLTSQPMYSLKNCNILTNQIWDADFWEFFDHMTEEEMAPKVLSSDKSSILFYAYLIRCKLTPL